MPPVLGAVGGALGAIGGGSAAVGALKVGATAAGVIGSRNAAKDAQQAITAGNEQSAALLERDRQQNIERLDPFIRDSGDALQLQRTIAGVEGPEAQGQFFDNFQFSPFAEFQRREGLRAIDQGSARAGTLRSGSRLKSIASFINDLSSREIQNQFNQAGSITGTGLQAALGLAGVNAPNVASQANLQQQTGLSRSEAILGRQSAFQSGVSDLAGSAIDFLRK